MLATDPRAAPIDLLGDGGGGEEPGPIVFLDSPNPLAIGLLPRLRAPNHGATPKY
jgi:hypothetical protein